MSSDNDALHDELEALGSIYAPDTLILTDQDAGVTSAILTIPGVECTFSLTFPPKYPDEPPNILGTYHIDANASKGAGQVATNVIRDVLGSVFVPGQVCIFDLIEEAAPLLAQSPATNHGETQDQTTSVASRSDSPVDASDSPLTHHDHAAIRSMPTPDWILSEPLVVNKSTFVARALAVKSLEEATESISHLISTNKRVAMATHNITAWRIRQKSAATAAGTEPIEITIQDCDDDGETAAGGRLLHLMQLMEIWNVVVVVTRWYGGVKLGPDRFRCINAVARDALVSGGFAGTEDTSSKNAGAKAGRRSKR